MIMEEFKAPYNKILIVRLSALGDTVLTLPLAWALRQAMPRVEIGWVVGQPAAEVLKNVSEIDRLHVWKKSDKNLKGLLRLCREIRTVDYDTALDTQGLTKSAMIPFLSHVPRRVGLARETVEGREISPVLNNIIVRPPESLTHVTRRILHLLKPLNIPIPDEVNGALPVDPKAREKMDAWCKAENLGDRVVVFSIGAGWPTKVWPADRVAALAEKAGEKGFQPVVLWGPSEEKHLKEWERIFPSSAVFAPPTSVTEMAALIHRSCALAGPDSVALHLASVLGRPTFSWFASSDPARCAPAGPGHRHVSIGTPTWSRTFKTVQDDDIRKLHLGTVLPAFEGWLEQQCRC
jgi:heptosyltransferase I